MAMSAHPGGLTKEMALAGRPTNAWTPAWVAKLWKGRETLTVHDVAALKADARDRLSLIIEYFLDDRRRRLLACDLAEQAMAQAGDADARFLFAISVARAYADGAASLERLEEAKEAARRVTVLEPRDYSDPVRVARTTAINVCCVVKAPMEVRPYNTDHDAAGQAVMGNLHNWGIVVNWTHPHGAPGKPTMEAVREEAVRRAVAYADGLAGRCGPGLVRPDCALHLNANGDAFPAQVEAAVRMYAPEMLAPRLSCEYAPPADAGVRHVDVPMGDDAVERRLLRMQAEAPTFHAPGLLGDPACREALGCVDYVALGHQVIEVQKIPGLTQAVQHSAEVAAASMAATLAEDAMRAQQRGVTPAGAVAAEALEQVMEAMDRTIEALAPATPGWTTHPDGSRSYYDPELSDAIEDMVNKAVLEKFAGVQPGAPGWFWFAEDRADGTEDLVVRRVVRDGSGGLWTDDRGHGVRVTTGMAAACEGPVAPYATQADREAASRAEAVKISTLVQQVQGDLINRLEAMLDAAGAPPYGPGINSTTDRVQAALDAYGALRATQGAPPPPDAELRADAQETAAFAVYDALTLLLGEAGLGPRVAPTRMQAWAQQILESLLRADVGWAIGVLADADATLRMRVRERREALADHVHMVWARWMAWQGEHVHLVPKAAALAMHTAAIERWARQAQTPYVELGEAERASDRAIAEEYVAILLGDSDPEGRD